MKKILFYILLIYSLIFFWGCTRNNKIGYDNLYFSIHGQLIYNEYSKELIFPAADQFVFLNIENGNIRQFPISGIVIIYSLSNDGKYLAFICNERYGCIDSKYKLEIRDIESFSIIQEYDIKTYGILDWNENGDLFYLPYKSNTGIGYFKKVNINNNKLEKLINISLNMPVTGFYCYENNFIIIDNIGHNYKTRDKTEVYHLSSNGKKILLKDEIMFFSFENNILYYIGSDYNLKEFNLQKENVKVISNIKSEYSEGIMQFTIHDDFIFLKIRKKNRILIVIYNLKTKEYNEIFKRKIIKNDVYDQEIFK